MLNYPAEALALKASILKSILKLEGGYVNDPSDSGGETNHGITVAVARKYGYTGPMADLPEAIALDIYEAMYWTPVRGDKLYAMSPVIAQEVVDTAINMGTSRAGQFLQRSLNILTDSFLEEDGIIGSATLSALKKYLATRDQHTLAKALNCLQGAFYMNLAEKRPKDRKFVYGWLTNRVSLSYD